ncbi:MAG TPA: VOC family protein [Candidatus Binataceae bacterium]|jgi:catechol 2,3-dioxygenase-like lactoylglutathione lyase family enzyme|nr:VOC family protein [Candidatus Binataceae bacterium]
MLQRLFHVNICVRDMDRSVRFYEEVGFTKVNDFMLDDPSLEAGLGIKTKKLRGVFMRVGDDPNAPALDLVQFLDPPTQGQPYPSLNHVGICRICFWVDNIDRMYERLRANKNIEFVGPLVVLHGSNNFQVKFVCLKDPDGSVLELMGHV